MENVEVQRDQEAQQIRSAWKRELFLLFEDPSSSPSAFVINVFVTFMIILSAVLTTIETIPSLRKGNSQMWFGFETGIVAVFTLEFILRFLGHTDTWQQAWNYGKSAITIIDALAIFPYYVELILHRDTSYEFRFTILRIFRLLRVFSAFKYSSLLQLSIEVMIVAVKRSSDALLAFLLFVALTVTLFSTLMYFAERGTWDEERQAFLTANGEYSTFSSIPAAAYYSIVTLTTTGFGDMVPTTFVGKLISFPMMIAGILLIALPSIIVGRNFTQVWE
ncbi:voltage-gated potassium channel, partial [Linderina pennispora]